jgi:hypothetical protein
MKEKALLMMITISIVTHPVFNIKGRVFCNLLIALRRCLVNMVVATVIGRPLAGEKVVCSSFSAFTVYCILFPY